MKKILLTILLAFQLSAHAQRSAIFFEDQAKFPSGLTEVKSWLVAMTSKLPFAFQDAKTSPNQDATFQRFSLALGPDKIVPIGNSGSAFELESSDGKPSKINVQYEGKWKISAYQPNFNLNTFNPSDYSKIYENALLVYNISEEQALAEFLNKYVTDDKLPSLKAFLRDAEKLTKKKFDIKNIDNVTLTAVVKEIYLKTNRYASDVAYQLYLKNKNQDKERANLANFFRKFTGGNVVDEFLNIATPQGKFYFEKSGVFLLLDQNIFICFG